MQPNPAMNIKTRLTSLADSRDLLLTSVLPDIRANAADRALTAPCSSISFSADAWNWLSISSDTFTVSMDLQVHNYINHVNNYIFIVFINSCWWRACEYVLHNIPKPWVKFPTTEACIYTI